MAADGMGWMDGRLTGREGWMKGTDEWREGRMEGGMDGRMDKTVEWMDGWMDEWRGKERHKRFSQNWGKKRFSTHGIGTPFPFFFRFFYPCSLSLLLFSWFCFSNKSLMQVTPSVLGRTERPLSYTIVAVTGRPHERVDEQASWLTDDGLRRLDRKI